MAQRGKGGLFSKGNKIAKKSRTPPDIKLMRDICRDRLTRMAYRLASEPKEELKRDLKENPDTTVLETFTANAISKNNSKFITWLFDQAVGRPKQIDIDNAQRPIEIKLNYDPFEQKREDEKTDEKE